MCFRATQEEYRQLDRYRNSDSENQPYLDQNVYVQKNRQFDGPENKPYWEQNIYIYIYSSLILGVLVITLLRSTIFFYFSVKCSQKLHDNMFMSIIKTSMRFFDTNPTGRILNR